LVRPLSVVDHHEHRPDGRRCLDEAEESLPHLERVGPRFAAPEGHRHLQARDGGFPEELFDDPEVETLLGLLAAGEQEANGLVPGGDELLHERRLAHAGRALNDHQRRLASLGPGQGVGQYGVFVGPSGE
jgi:hypothetical protein